MESKLESKLNEKYVRGVSFDAMNNADLRHYSFTLRGKTPGYKRTRRSRTFMMATDLANYSEYALNWASDEVMDDGDELIVLRVVTVDMSDKRSIIQAQLEYESKQAREKANKVMERIMESSGPDSKISVIIEFVIGKVQETIQDMISMYQPSLLIVGTRGLSEFQGMLLGSVSKYCLQHSPIPVTVVRPVEDKSIKKHKAKKNRLSAMIRLGGSRPGSESDSDDEKQQQHEEKQHPERPTLDKRFGRLSFIGRSRSPSPSPSNSKSRSK
ncbi:uncharacterized protein BX664DRAFT_286854 [Halteromyces radiatus]|uniref:uncharacterized protein n=1 Tax=Halteromyces radiatus TaxID=101107 RepID=UPI00221EF166|nr:uncharacterized protein BX664DRAFT_286854 [Halteromyces radiatus]KAI8078743.1 hypothetical protein BX664DRAFT_286854 [Halteromyces radiatus]